MNNTNMLPMEIPYKKVGDYYFPMITYPAADRPIGHWGKMLSDYLKEHRPRVFLSAGTEWTVFHRVGRAGSAGAGALRTDY